MKQYENDFCMKQFKPAIAVMAALVVVIVGWTLWRLCPGSFITYTPAPAGARPAMLAAAKTPSGPPIDVKAKMTHPDWGNCNKCHVTTGAAAPVSKVMTGPPILIAQKATHKYWGNCMLCHQVRDGWQANGVYIEPQAVGAPAQAAGLPWLTAESFGLSIQPVTGAMMAKFDLPKEEALLVIDVAPGSLADKAGFKPGDEIVRVGKSPTASVASFEAALNDAGPGDDVKFAVFTGKRSRNIIVSLPKDLAPLFSPPSGAGQDALAGTPSSIVAVAVTGPTLDAPLAQFFDNAPYFVLVDQVNRSFRVEANPNAALPGRGVQTGELMANLKAGEVIAGSFSPEASATLGNLRIVTYPGVTGPAKQVIEIFQAGGLRSAQAASAALAPGAQPRAALAPGTPSRAAAAPGANVTLF
jgi:predicted Fe-Mo cluster-binding NifX family protein